MRVGLVQHSVALADFDANLERAAAGARRTRDRGAELVLLPEFFASGMAFDPGMLEVPRQQARTRCFVGALAKELDAAVGGSFLTFDGNDAHNTFVLAFPDGAEHVHQKDIPTMVENAYYTGGHDDGVLETGIGRIGVALCWEMIRTQTVERLAGRVDFVLAASCWWGHCPPYEESAAEVQARNVQMLRDAPCDLARLLGVPVVHASCVGRFQAATLSHPDRSAPRCFLGLSRIVGADGAPLAALEQGSEPGVLVSELPPAARGADRALSGYWIPTLTESHLRAWETDARLGKQYYTTVALPRYKVGDA